jgi:hypothetical protein
MPLSKLLIADKGAFYSVSCVLLFNISNEMIHSQPLIYKIAEQTTTIFWVHRRPNLCENSLLNIPFSNFMQNMHGFQTVNATDHVEI